jgi:Fur family peroxide stress response transcriptional regulator
MDETTKQQRIESLRQLCREQGLRCTVQRRLILETTLDVEDHPTADQVYDNVSGRIPGISRTTVYRTLESLSRMGLITKTCHPGSVVRYDCRTELHHHLICLRCDHIDNISDERLDSLQIPDTSAFGFEVSDFKVQLHVICRRCRETEAKEEST